MITDPMLTPIGTTGKPHGINGELNLLLDDDFTDSGLTPDDLRCVVMDVDGINVPFFIDSWRAKGTNNVLIKIDGVDNEIQAKELANKTVSALKEDVETMEVVGEDDGFYATDLIGYSINVDHQAIGVIADIEDSTENALFIIKRNYSDKPLYIPIAEQFITGINPDTSTIDMTLPEGLLNL